MIRLCTKGQMQRGIHSQTKGPYTQEEPLSDVATKNHGMSMKFSNDVAMMGKITLSNLISTLR